MLSCRLSPTMRPPAEWCDLVIPIECYNNWGVLPTATWHEVTNRVSRFGGPNFSKNWGGLSPMIDCKICHQTFKSLNQSHLAHHDLTPNQYKKKFRVKYIHSKEIRKKIGLTKIGNTNTKGK